MFVPLGQIERALMDDNCSTKAPALAEERTTIRRCKYFY